MHDPSRLFGKPGYIPLKEYLADIDEMIQYGPWRLPLRAGDRIHLGLLRFISKFSWFSDSLFVAHASGLSPAYAVLFSYAKRHKIFDALGERDLHSRGFFSYFLNKTVSLPARKESLMTGQGVASDRATAFSKALGEILERMVSGVYDMNSSSITDSPQNMDANGIPTVYPPKFHRFLQVQKERFKSLNCDPSISIEWVEGKGLISHKPVFIPKSMTSWFIGNRSKKNFFMHATTNGSAGYFTRAGATLRGLLEIVQRDGFLVHWLTMIAPQVIQHETLPEDLKARVREFESYGFSIYILNVTAIPIPSVIIAITNEHAAYPPQVTLSGASDMNFHDAIENALREIMVGSEMFYYENGSKTGLEETEPEPFVSHFGKTERQLYWRGKEKMENFRWFISGEEVAYGEICRKFDAVEVVGDGQKLNQCLRILKKLGDDYYPVVYFPRHPVQQGLGFYIAQVYIPKAFPFYLVEYLGTFDSDRLKEFAQSKGVANWKLNPLPHMFS